jgi:dnd system-associated protein 4
LGQRKEIQKRGEAIRYSIFEGAVDETFINAVAIAETGDLKIVSDERAEERIQIFEEYAHAGLIELQNRLAVPGEDLEHVLQLVMDERAAKQAPVGVIPDLANLFNR